MSDNAMTDAPALLDTLRRGLTRLVMVKAVQVSIAFLSWLVILLSCVLLSRGEIDCAWLLAGVTAILRCFPPWSKSWIFKFDVLCLSLPVWGMYITGPRADSQAAVLTYQISAIVLLFLFICWHLIRDWYRFKHPYNKTRET